MNRTKRPLSHHDSATRKQSEPALLREATDQAILHALPDMICRLTADGVFVDCRRPPGFRPVVRPSQLLGQSVEQVLPRDVGPAALQALRRALATGTMQHLEFGLPVGGDRRSYEARVVPTGDGHALALVRDITELRRAEARYRQLFEEAPVMYAITRNVDGVPFILDCNQRFLSTLGYQRAEMIDRPLADLYTPASRDELLQSDGYRRALEGRFTVAERQLVTRAGRVVETLLNAVPETDAEGRVIGTRTMYVDITERKRAEAERNLLLEREQAARADAEAAATLVRRLQSVTDAGLAYLSLDALLRGLLSRITAMLSVDTATILMREPDGDHLVVRAAYGLEEHATATTRIPIGAGFAGRVAAEQRPIVVEDSQQIEILNPALLVYGVRSLLGVPLLIEGRLIGVLHVGSLQRRQFTDDDTHLLQSAGDRAALVIEHARLFHEAEETALRERQHALALRRLTTASLAISLVTAAEELPRTVAEQARVVIGARQAITALAQPGHRRATRVAVARDDQPRTRRVPPRWSLGAPLVEQVCQANRPVRLTRAELEQRLERRGRGAEQPDDLPARGWLAAPLSGRDGVNLGVIQLFDKEDGQFTEQDEAILVQLAQLASAALESLRLQQQATAAAAALEADRLKTDLLNTVSHELRTPLAAIKGFSTTLIMYGDRLEAEERTSFLEEIDQAADRLTELVDNLLQLSRLESGTLQMVHEPVALSAVLVRTVEDVHRRHPHRRITPAIAADLPPVTGDARRLGQVVANLLDNAVKYSPDGGAIEVAAHTEPGGLTFSVTDHGLGIPTDSQARVFERFYRVETGPARDIGGTGLGLAICRLIVEAHGGRIGVVSREGAGSTFSVFLPARERSG